MNSLQQIPLFYLAFQDFFFSQNIQNIEKPGPIEISSSGQSGGTNQQSWLDMWLLG